MVPSTAREDVSKNGGQHLGYDCECLPVMAARRLAVGSVGCLSTAAARGSLTGNAPNTVAVPLRTCPPGSNKLTVQMSDCHWAITQQEQGQAQVHAPLALGANCIDGLSLAPGSSNGNSSPDLRDRRRAAAAAAGGAAR